MGITDSLSEFYFKIEDFYYGVCDRIQSIGIPVYDWFVEPIEKRGVPSFPVAVLILLLLLGGVVYLLLPYAQPGAQYVTLTVSVASGGSPVSGAGVTLDIEGGEQRSDATNAEGIAKFENVSAGKKANVTVKKYGFKDAIEEITISEEAVAIRLESLPGQLELLLQVENRDGDPISGAEITYNDPLTSELIVVYTEDEGSVKVKYSDPTEVFNLHVQADGYKDKYKTCPASARVCKIVLEPEELPPNQDGPDDKGKGSVLVDVKNESGAYLDATVELYAGSTTKPVDALYTQSGQAYFKKIVDKGTEVYIIVKPKDSSYEEYNGAKAAFEVKEENEVGVVLKKKPVGPPRAATYGFINFTVLGEGNKPIEGAEVTLFWKDRPTRVAYSAKPTDEKGRVFFEVARGMLFYATIYADGYLPFTTQSVEAGQAKEILLEKAVIGGYGEAEITVYDADDKPAEMADVDLYDENGFNVGLPTQKTTADGKVRFTPLPPKRMRAYARQGAVDGWSDFFTVIAGDIVNTSMKLRVPYGKILVETKDVTDGKAIEANVSAFIGEDQQSSCSTKEGKACELSVPAKKSVILKANASGYVSKESSEIIVTVNELRKETLYLTPSALANELNISRVVVLDDDNKEVNFLERGKYYTVKLIANFPPGNDRAGIYLRIGDKATPEEEPAYITYYEPSDESVWSNSFNPGGDCGIDLANQDDSRGIKWVNWGFKRVTGKDAMARIFVKASATSKDKLLVNYRAYAVKGRVWSRYPEDPDLGQDEKTGEKDWCYAKTLNKKLSIVEGKATCTERACLVTSFGENKQGSGFNVDLNTEFPTNFELTTFGTFSQPFLKITSLDELTQFSAVSGSAAILPVDLSGKTEGRISLAEGFVSTYNGSATGNAVSKVVLPSYIAKIRVSFNDKDGEIVRTEGYVVPQGTGTISVGYSPQSLSANIRRDMEVTVKTSQGVPVEDAHLSLEEIPDDPVARHPFSGESYHLLGDGAEGSGKGGVYLLNDVYTTSAGKVKLVAKREGFRDEDAEIEVKAEDFLQLEPSDQLSVDCSHQTLKITNTLDTSVPVTAYFKEGVRPCVQIFGANPAGSNRYEFTLGPKGEKLLSILPNLRTFCMLSFHSQLEGVDAITDQDLGVTVTCTDVAECSPSMPCLEGKVCVEGNCVSGATTTTTPNGVCSSLNCPVCTEQECLALSQYCEPHYPPAPSVVYPTGTSPTQFLGCFQKAEVPDCKALLDQRYAIRFFENFWKNFYLLKKQKSEDKKSDPLAVNTGQYSGVVITNNPAEGVVAMPSSVELKVAPLLPINAFPISIDNSVNQFELRYDWTPPQCLKIVSFDNFEQELTGITVPAGKVRTVVAIVKKECVKLTYKPGDNKMKITVKGSESSFTDSITFGPKGGIAGKATISVKIVPDTLGSSFAFQEVNLFPPDSLSVHSRVFTKMPKAVEPFYFVNNIHYPTDSAIEVVELSTGDTQRIEPNELGSLLIQVAKDVRNAETPTFAETTYGGYKLRMDSSDIGKRSTTSENLVGIPASLNNLLNYDVIGDSGKRTGTNIEARQQCSYEYFCPQEDFKTAADDVTKNINEEWKRVHSYLTKVTPTKMSLRSDFELGLEAFLVGAFETSLEMNADPEYSQCYGTSLSQGLFGACQAMFKSNQYPPSATLWEFLRTGARVACQIELFDFVIKARSQADLYMAKYCMGNYFQGFYTPGVFQQPWPQYGQPPYYSGPGTFQGCMWGGSPYGGGDIFTKYAGEECSFFIERAPWTTASFKWVLKKAGAGGGIKVLDYEIGGKEHNEASLVLKDAGGTSFPSANGFPYVDYTGSVVKYDDHAPKLYTMNKYGFRPYKTEDKTGDQLDVVTDIKKLVPGIGKLTDGTVLVSSNLLSATDPSLDEEKRALVIGISMNVLDQTSPLLKVETMEQLESVSEELVQYLIDEKYSGLPNLKQLLSSSGLEGYTDCKMDVNEKSIVVKCKPPPQPSNGITVTLSADQLTVQKQGDPTTLTVTINKEGLPTPYQPPEAVSYYISQQEISGSYPVKEFKPASVLQGTFHFTHNLAEAGTYRVVVKIGANDEYASNTVTLNIASQPSPPQFSLTVSPDIIYREDLQPPKNVGISISIPKPPDTSAYEVSMAIKDGHDAYTNYVPGLPKAQIMPLPVHADYPWTVDKNVPVGAYNVKLFAKYPGIKPVKYSLKTETVIVTSKLSSPGSTYSAIESPGTTTKGIPDVDLIEQIKDKPLICTENPADLCTFYVKFYLDADAFLVVKIYEINVAGGKEQAILKVKDTFNRLGGTSIYVPYHTNMNGDKPISPVFGLIPPRDGQSHKYVLHIYSYKLSDAANVAKGAPSNDEKIEVYIKPGTAVPSGGSAGGSSNFIVTDISKPFENAQDLPQIYVTYKGLPPSSYSVTIYSGGVEFSKRTGLEIDSPDKTQAKVTMSSGSYSQLSAASQDIKIRVESGSDCYQKIISRDGVAGEVTKCTD